MYQVAIDEPSAQTVAVPGWVGSVLAAPMWDLCRLTSTSVASITLRGVFEDRKQRGQLLNAIEELAEKYDLEVLVDFADDNGFTLRFTEVRL